MGVGNGNLLQNELLFAQQFQNLLNFIARVDDHCFMGLFIVDDRTVALERTDREDADEHRNMLRAGGATGYWLQEQKRLTAKGGQAEQTARGETWSGKKQK